MVSPTATSTYYSMAAFGLLAPVAVVYAVTVNFWLALLGRRRVLVVAVPETSSSSSSVAAAAGGRTAAAGPPLPPPPPPRVAVCTGGNTGIGYKTACALVRDHGYTVILACRSRHKAEAAARQINQHNASDGAADAAAAADADDDAAAAAAAAADDDATDSQALVVPPRGRAVFLQPLDLANFNSVRDFGDRVKRHYPIIHVLVNNAGRNTSGVSDDDLDLLFQSNFLGHFLLTSLLMPCLLRAPTARVVNLSSVMHHFCAGSPIESAEYWKHVAAADQGPSDTYSLSKLAAVLFAVELNRHYGGGKNNMCRSIAVNPGAVNSDIWRDFPRFVIPFFSLVYLNNRQGCCTSVVAAVSTELPSDAIYLQPYWLPWSTHNAPFPLLEMLGPYLGYRVTPPRLPADGGFGAASALWDACNDLTGAKWPSTK